MKFYSLFMIALSLVSIPSEARDSRVFILKPQYAFTPKGFDTNDNAQVVLAGAFSDYCMKVGTTQHRVDRVNKKIYIDQTYSTMDDCNDIEMYIPYSIEVNLGILPAGNYEVLLLDTDRQYTAMSTLPIGDAKSPANGSDERLYAPVSSIEFKVGHGPNPKLLINGVFTNTCLSLKNVEVHQRTGDVFDVLPIAVDSKTNCKATMKPYSKVVELPGFSLRNTLIHVRSMNGQSINKVITTLDRLK